MAMLQIFKSRLARIQYVFRDGTTAVFAPRTHAGQGHYLTGDAKKAAELDEVVKAGHPHFFRDPDEMEVDEKLADPAVALREQIREEERAKIIAELGDPNQMQGASKINLPDSLKTATTKVDAGSTENKSALGGIGNSTTTAAAAAESNAK